MTRDEHRQWAKELIATAADIMTDEQIKGFIDSALDIMDGRQVGQWEGVRAWAEFESMIQE